MFIKIICGRGGWEKLSLLTPLGSIYFVLTRQSVERRTLYVRKNSRCLDFAVKRLPRYKKEGTRSSGIDLIFAVFQLNSQREALF